MAGAMLFGSTKTKILQQLRAGPHTAGDLARSLRIQPSAVRKHLERLSARGIVDERFVRAGRGRPKKVYALTEAGRELFPRTYDAVLDRVLRAVRSEQGDDGARALLRRVAQDLAHGVASGSATKRLERATQLLDDLGFEVSVDERAGVKVITSRNCPILRIAAAHREIVCEGLHGEVLRRAMGSRRVRRERWIVDGDSVCTHVLDV